MRRARTHAAGALLLLILPAAARAQAMPMAMEDRMIHSYVSFDELELVTGPEERPVEFDALAWVGGDVSRVWVKARGEQATTGTGAGELEGQVLYGRVLTPFWDVQAGLRVDALYGEGTNHTRGLLAVGLQGLAPYWFEVESTFFVSQSGDVSARLQASYDLLLTQRLILEPEVQLDLAVQEVPELEVGSGLSAVEAGARLRYEIVRELAPYVGIAWQRRAVGSADRAREEGTSFVAGVRWWY